LKKGADVVSIPHRDLSRFQLKVSSDVMFQRDRVSIPHRDLSRFQLISILKIALTFGVSIPHRDLSRFQLSGVIISGTPIDPVSIPHRDLSRFQLGTEPKQLGFVFRPFQSLIGI